MTRTKTVSGGVGKGTVLETHISPEDLQRTTDATPPSTCAEGRPTEPQYSTEVMESFERAKQAGEVNDMRSRRINRGLWGDREGDMTGAPGLVGQTAIFDFKRVE